MLRDEVLTVQDVMALCKVSRDTVSAWIRGGKGRTLKHTRIGRLIRIRAEWLDEFLTPVASPEQPEPSEARRIARGLGLVPSRRE
jgi:excisionase family DNA binding protein